MNDEFSKNFFVTKNWEKLLKLKIFVAQNATKYLKTLLNTPQNPKTLRIKQTNSKKFRPSEVIQQGTNLNFKHFEGFFGCKPIFGRMQYIAIAKKSFAKIHVHKFLNKIFILKMCPQVVLDIMSMAINYYFLKIPLHINSKLLQNYPHLNKKNSARALIESCPLVCRHNMLIRLQLLSIQTIS